MAATRFAVKSSKISPDAAFPKRRSCNCRLGTAKHLRSKFQLPLGPFPLQKGKQEGGFFPLGISTVFEKRSFKGRTKPTYADNVDPMFENYRKAIQDAFHVDIKNFQEKITGGMADGKPVTNYDLKQLLGGIKWEREHTDDSFFALEIAMDHLERIPDYYTRLLKLERGATSDRLLQM